MADAPTPTPPTEPTPAAAPQAPFEPQVAPQAGQPVQYVVTQQSLRGIGGWLAFAIVVLGLIGIGNIVSALGGGSSSSASSNTPIDTLFGILIGIAFLATTVLLAMQKKIGIMAAYVSLAISATYGVITALINTSEKPAGEVTGYIIGTVLIYALIALYFRNSRRVKETLIN